MRYIKQFFWAILYTFVLIIILGIINWSMGLMIKNIIGPLFSWFYDLHWAWKLLLVFLGGSIIIGFFLNIIKYLATLISTILNVVFPYNKAMVIISTILVAWNIIVLEIAFWPLITWDFWIICLWFIIAFFILQVNLIFIFRNPENE